MSELKPQETQQELFPVFTGPEKKPERFPPLAKAQKPVLISTNAEQLILAGIILILAACFVFFLGVLRGRSLGAETPRAPRAVEAPAPVAAPAVDPARLQSVKRALQKERALAVSPQAVPAVSASVKSAAQPAAAKAGSKPYTIQLATFKKREMAEKEVAALRRNGFLAAMSMSGDYYEVCVGQYANIDEAKKDLRLFASRYKDRFLRRR